jgi:hypothetical protein
MFCAHVESSSKRSENSIAKCFPFQKAVPLISSQNKVNQSSQNLFKGSMIGGTALLHSTYRAAGDD